MRRTFLAPLVVGALVLAACGDDSDDGSSSGDDCDNTITDGVLTIATGEPAFPPWVLEDTPENGAIWTVERFRRQIVNEIEGITVWAGVAGYPAHAFDADTVVRLAEQALHSARDWGRDRIEVAPSP